LTLPESSSSQSSNQSQPNDGNDRPDSQTQDHDRGENFNCDADDLKSSEPNQVDAASPVDSSPDSIATGATTKRSLFSIAGIVALATLLSKVFGLFRQMAIAAAFGVGAAVDAYNYAYVIPGFLLVLLGGINGPFHSAIVSVLSKRDVKAAAPLVETITTLVGGVLLLVSIALVFFAQPMIDVVAPGLGSSPEGLEIRAIAVQQLRIMAPMAVLAGLIGIGFGTLNASNQYWLPSVSPMFSSLAVLLAIGFFALAPGSEVGSSAYAIRGGMVLAWGTLAGAIWQWLAQITAQWRSGMGSLRLRFNFRLPGVRQILKIMLPATFSSGLLHINVYTDLFFASYIPQAAAALGYAQLLVQTPLGLLSNIILVPLLPVFCRLTEPDDWDELKDRIRQGMMLTAITMIPLSALIMTLALPAVRLVYERFAFDQSASRLVSSVLVAYGVGMFVYLGRDVMVRVFYALGDGSTPFKVSMVGVGLNALFDYIFVKQFGAPGLALSTAGVNLVSLVALVWLLDRKLNGLRWQRWIKPLVGITVISAIAGVTSWSILQGINQLWQADGSLMQLVQLALAGGGGLLVFLLLVVRLRLPEVDRALNKLKQKLPMFR
jgi:putative peptidoglycan lipid II flippase